MEYDIEGYISKFSPAISHGPSGIRLGFVIMVSIENKEKLLFAINISIFEPTNIWSCPIKN